MGDHPGSVYVWAWDTRMGETDRTDFLGKKTICFGDNREIHHLLLALDRHVQAKQQFLPKPEKWKYSLDNQQGSDSSTTHTEWHTCLQGPSSVTMNLKDAYILTSVGTKAESTRKLRWNFFSLLSGCFLKANKALKHQELIRNSHWLSLWPGPAHLSQALSSWCSYFVTRLMPAANASQQWRCLHDLGRPCDATQMQRLVSTKVCAWTPHLGELVFTGSVNWRSCCVSAQLLPSHRLLNSPQKRNSACNR